MIIYKITNLINGKIYIGQTVRELEERIGEHKRKRNSLVGKAIKKYGEENFSIEVVDKGCSLEELNNKEIKWIQHYGCVVPFGYNQCYGGNNTMGYNHKDESRKKMSISKQGMYDKEKNHFYGKTHTEETRAKMRLAWKTKRVMTDEMKQKLRDKHPTKKVINLDTGEVFESINDACEKYNLQNTHISRVCRGKRKKTGGYRWMYYNEYKEKEPTS